MTSIICRRILRRSLTAYWPDVSSIAITAPWPIEDERDSSEGGGVSGGLPVSGDFLGIGSRRCSLLWCEGRKAGLAELPGVTNVECARE
jgi:hypothetical protein